MNTQESVEASKLLRGVYLSIVRPPDLLSPIESRDVTRLIFEAHKIEPIRSSPKDRDVTRLTLVREDSTSGGSGGDACKEECTLSRCI